jgi:hypothetical protein
MATTPQQGGFYSTPAFEIFRRGLIVQTIKRFRGLNVSMPLTQLTPDIASDLLNVIVSNDGLLAKLRLPIALSQANPSGNVGPFSFWDFQQGSGLRQVLAHFGQDIYAFDPAFAAPGGSLIDSNALNTPPWSFVEANNILFGANGQRMQKWTGAGVATNGPLGTIIPAPGWEMWGIAQPIITPTLGPQTAGNLSPATGYQYQYAYKNSVTGHVGNASLASNSTGAAASKQFQVNAVASTDSQVDTIVWFRNLDGGGDFFRLAEVNLVNGIVSFNTNTVTVVAATGNLDIVDNTPDSSLDLTTRAPLINNPPPVGTYTALAQGRVFIAGLVGAGADVVYSGYEQIVVGRPEESFPPNNRIRLTIGAESVVGLGVLHSGVVMFSSTGKLWMLRGAVEDITLSAPVAFSEFLEELPWPLGCLSHYTIQSTPYGLVWLAGDKTVQFWDGRSDPTDISESVYALLRTITPGTERLCAGAFFNWLERDWYALTCATGGAAAPNTIIFFGLNNDTKQIDVFVSNLQADWLGVQSTAALQRRLLISHGGVISEIPVKATDTGGLTTDFTTYPPTSGVLRAYWRSGYFGNDQPEQSKMFRWTRQVVDSGISDYQITSRYVDDANLINAPRIVGPVQAVGMRTPLNQRGYRVSVEIDFPETDASMSVMELQVAYIGTSQR